MIDKALKNIPLVWPLQQFVATNPLNDLLEMDIQNATERMGQLSKEPMVLSFGQYFKAYELGEITNHNLHAAIEEFLHKNHYEKLSENEKSFCQHLLFGFITTPALKDKFLSEEKHYNNQLKHKAWILSSYQRQDECYDELLTLVNQDFYHWIGNFFQPVFKAKENFFELWYQSYWMDKGHNVIDEVRVLPNNFIEACFLALDILPELQAQYIEEILWQIKGWAGFIKWQMHYPQNPWHNKLITIEELIAVWLGIEYITLKKYHVNLKEGIGVANQPNIDNLSTLFSQYLKQQLKLLPQGSQKTIKDMTVNLDINIHQLYWIWQYAYELQYQNELVDNIINTQASYENNSHLANLIFCIDVRSEPVRRSIEQVGNYSTMGFAGFFGLSFNLKKNNAITCQCPALLSPNETIKSHEEALSFMDTLVASIQNGFAHCKDGMLSPFVLFEMLGIWKTLTVLYKNYVVQYLSPKDETLSISDEMLFDTFSLESLLDYAKNLIQALRLNTLNTPFIILCGHTATTENNPYQAALDCGACGGNSGLPNALLACQILNNPMVRQKLLLENIHFKQGVKFIAACHNTTLDTLTLHYNPSILTDEQKLLLIGIQKDIKRAMQCVSKERKALLPGNIPFLSRKTHWAELIPEWGLANNAAFIIAPRAMTKQVNLNARVFLHEYFPQQDPTLKNLENILLAPLIVAFWINMQYYFSSVAQKSFGSGNKAIHNIVSNIGVIEGNSSDLKFGLPKQSVMYHGKLIHEPRRLSVIIYAEEAQVMPIIKKHEVLSQLIDGNWLHVIFLSPSAYPLETCDV